MIFMLGIIIVFVFLAIVAWCLVSVFVFGVVIFGRKRQAAPAPVRQTEAQKQAVQEAGYQRAIMRAQHQKVLQEQKDAALRANRDTDIAGPSEWEWQK